MMTDLLKHIRIVLIETSHPGNIGAAARAMKTMGLSRLVLVRPRDYPSAEATARAAGADDVLAQAEVYETLEDAIADCILVIGSSARSRRIEWAGLSTTESADSLLEQAQHGQQVALIFGRERTGLSNEELVCCQQVAAIDANPAHSSLNLAAAVQVFCYEIRKQLLATEEPVLAKPSNTEESVLTKPSKEILATSNQLEGLFSHFDQTLTDIGIAQPGKPKTTLMMRLRRLFFRTHLTDVEVNILRGILSAAQGCKQKKQDQ